MVSQVQFWQGIRTIQGVARHITTYASKAHSSIGKSHGALQQLETAAGSGNIMKVQKAVPAAVDAFSKQEDALVGIWKAEQIVFNWIQQRERGEVAELREDEGLLKKVKNEVLRKKLKAGLQNLDKALTDVIHRTYNEAMYLKAAGRDIAADREGLIDNLRHWKTASTKALARKEWFLAWRARGAVKKVKKESEHVASFLKELHDRMEKGDEGKLKPLADLLAQTKFTKKIARTIGNLLSLIHEIHRDMTIIHMRMWDSLKEFKKKVDNLRPQGYPLQQWRQLENLISQLEKDNKTKVDHMWHRTRYQKRVAAKV